LLCFSQMAGTSIAVMTRTRGTSISTGTSSGSKDEHILRLRCTFTLQRNDGHIL
jgi:hypothetical protein